jgi:beta-glucuronidase
LHSDYPNQALVITEFGAEASRAGPVTEKGTYDFQSDFLRYHLGIFEERPFINAALIWNLRDFRVKPGWIGGNPYPNPPHNQKGLVDDAGQAKPGFFAAQEIYRRTGPWR